MNPEGFVSLQKDALLPLVESELEDHLLRRQAVNGTHGADQARMSLIRRP